MKDEIMSGLEDPHQLESLYRSDRTGFKQAFAALYPQIADHSLAAFWNARLNFVKEVPGLVNRRELCFVVMAAVVAAVIAKIPAIFPVADEFFYTRNVGFIVFPVLSAYFAWKNKMLPGHILFIVLTMLAGLIFINSLPGNMLNDTVTLSCIHLVFFLWSVFGFAFTGESWRDPQRRLSFLKYNGDLVVMTTLILIAGAILTGITIGLFSLIRISIERFYFDYVVITGLAAAPVIATYLIQTNPHLVGKVSPVIARIFSPIVLVMLIIYLLAMAITGKDPFNDREFLLVFNLLLIGVMAIIFFSVAEASKTERNPAEIWVLFLLSVVTIVVNGIALSAILFRISSWGVTPNRLAVLGGNILILVNLLLVMYQLYRSARKKEVLDGVGRVIAMFLPVYFAWTIIVTFLFPFIFCFK